MKEKIKNIVNAVSFAEGEANSFDLSSTISTLLKLFGEDSSTLQIKLEEKAFFSKQRQHLVVRYRVLGIFSYTLDFTLCDRSGEIFHLSIESSKTNSKKKPIHLVYFRALNLFKTY